MYISIRIQRSPLAIIKILGPSYEIEGVQFIAAVTAYVSLYREDYKTIISNEKYSG